MQRLSRMSVHRVLPGYGRHHSCSAEEMQRDAALRGTDARFAMTVSHSALTDRSFEVKVAPDEDRQMLFRRPSFLPTTFATAIASDAPAACRTATAFAMGD